MHYKVRVGSVSKPMFPLLYHALCSNMETHTPPPHSGCSDSPTYPANVAIRSDDNVQVFVLITERGHSDIHSAVRGGQHAELSTGLGHLGHAREGSVLYGC